MYWIEAYWWVALSWAVCVAGAAWQEIGHRREMRAVRGHLENRINRAVFNRKFRHRQLERERDKLLADLQFSEACNARLEQILKNS